MAKPTTGPGRTARSGRPTAARPLGPRPQRVPSEAKSPARRRLERVSAGPLLRLHRLPRLVLPLVMGALLLAGLLVPGAWAGLFLVILTALLAWLVALSWPALAGSAKVIRVLVVVVIAAAAIWRLTGHS